MWFAVRRRTTTDNNGRQWTTTERQRTTSSVVAQRLTYDVVRCVNGPLVVNSRSETPQVQLRVLSVCDLSHPSSRLCFALVGLSVSRITQKVVDELRWISRRRRFYEDVRFCADPCHNPRIQEFLMEFLPLRDSGNSKTLFIIITIRCNVGNDH